MNDIAKSRLVRPVRVSPIGRFARGRRPVDWPVDWNSQDGAGSAGARSIDAAGRGVADSAVEASKSVFAASEPESAALRNRANSAYGSADNLDRTLFPNRRLTI